MSKLLIANWKMNPATMAEAIKLAKASDKTGVVICPPFVYMATIKKHVLRAKLGAQDVFYEDKGKYTGEISPAMLRNLGAGYVIVGHSERRSIGETDEIINKKVRAAVKAGLKVILCVGEPLSIRRKGLSAAKRFVAGQLRKDLRSGARNVVVAYEPIWAVGTGKPDDPRQAAEMARFIKSYLTRSKVLYGGSVTSKNVVRIMSHGEIDGALVGGASLNRKEFSKIIKLTL